MCCLQACNSLRSSVQEQASRLYRCMALQARCGPARGFCSSRSMLQFAGHCLATVVGQRLSVIGWPHVASSLGSKMCRGKNGFGARLDGFSLGRSTCQMPCGQPRVL